jgi:hypothetical protein
MFWFKRKEIVVDCFTIHRSVYELYKPHYSIKYFPADIKKIPKSFKYIDDSTKIEYDGSTIRSCIGLIEHYKHGITLPMWTDFICQPKTAVAGETAIGLMGNPFYFSSHPKNQYPGLYEDHIHVKLGSPWLFREKTGVRFLWNQATWNLSEHWKHFLVLPGTVSYDVQGQTNVNIFIDKNSENFKLTAGTPLVHITPLSENKVKIKTHLVSYEEHQKISVPEDYMMVPGGRRYLKYISDKKREHERDSPKCPFGFGK